MHRQHLLQRVTGSDVHRHPELWLSFRKGNFHAFQPPILVSLRDIILNVCPDTHRTLHHEKMDLGFLHLKYMIRKKVINLTAI